MPEVTISGTNAVVVQRGDYKVPSYQISEIALDLRLDPENTEVSACLHFQCTATAPVTELHLDGESLKLLSLQRDGRTLAEHEYRLTDAGLVLLNPPESFVLESRVRIH
ncbi:MAG: aminopeptidase N, partial [Acidithiobacillus ferriphilus]